MKMTVTVQCLNLLQKNKNKRPLQDRNYTSDNISAFTQATQGTMETRIGEIETQIEDFTTNIITLLENSETKRKIQADLQSKKNQEKMNQLQEALNQMIKISIQKITPDKMNDDDSKNSTKIIRTNKSNKSNNTKGSNPKKRNTDLSAKEKRTSQNLQAKRKQ